MKAESGKARNQSTSIVRQAGGPGGWDRAAAMVPGRLLGIGVRAAIVIAVASATTFGMTLRSDTWEELGRFSWWYLPILLSLVVVSWAANGLRTALLARVLGHQVRVAQAFKVTLATEFASSVTPGGVGGVAVRLTLQRRLGLARSATMSMMAADVAADILFFAVIWPLGAVSVWRVLQRSSLLERAGGSLRGSVEWLVIGVGAALIGLVLVRRYGRRSRSGAPLSGAVSWQRGLRRMKLHLIRFWRHGKAAFVLCCVVAAVQWTCRYGVLPVILCGFGVAVEPLPLVLLQGALFLLSMLIVLPGGGGSVEVLSALVLPLVAPVAVVGLVVVLWRFFTYYLHVLVGGIVLWRETSDRSNPSDWAVTRR